MERRRRGASCARRLRAAPCARYRRAPGQSAPQVRGVRPAQWGQLGRPRSIQKATGSSGGRARSARALDFLRALYGGVPSSHVVAAPERVAPSRLSLTPSTAPAAPLPGRCGAAEYRCAYTLGRKAARAGGSCQAKQGGSPLASSASRRGSCAPRLRSNVLRAVSPGSCPMTRSSNRLAAAAVAVGSHTAAAVLSPRAQAAAATAQGVDPATRSTDEDDAGWTPEHYDFSPETMVRRGAAGRHGCICLGCAPATRVYAATWPHARALRTQLASRRTMPVDAACPMLPGLCAKTVVVSERSPSPPVASDDGSKDHGAAQTRVCQARARSQPHRACVSVPSSACVAQLWRIAGPSWFMPSPPRVPLPGTHHTLRLAPPTPPRCPGAAKS